MDHLLTEPMSPFCENTRCQFNIATPATNVLKFTDRNDNDQEKSVKRLHVIQQTPGGPPKDFYFCENCSNVLAMCFGRLRSDSPSKE